MSLTITFIFKLSVALQRAGA